MSKKRRKYFFFFFFFILLLFLFLFFFLADGGGRARCATCVQIMSLLGAVFVNVCMANVHENVLEVVRVGVGVLRNAGVTFHDRGSVGGE